MNLIKSSITNFGTVTETRYYYGTKYIFALARTCTECQH